jgi:hypothetical protein
MIQIIKLLIYSLFFVFPFGQLTRLPWFGPEIKLYLHDIIISLLVILWLLNKLVKKQQFSWPKLTKPIIIFFLAGLLSLILALPHYQPQQILVSSLYLSRWLVYSGLYFVLSDQAIRTKLSCSISSLLLTAAAGLAGLGILQYLFIPDTRFLKYSGWDDHYYRVIATFFDPAFVGAIYVLAILLIFSYFKKLKHPYLLFTGLFLPLMLTYSRSSYLALISGTILIVWQKKIVRPFIGLLTLMLIIASFLPRPGGEGVKLERLYSIRQRAQNWQQGLQIVKQEPFFGVGFNTLRYWQKNSGSLGQDWQSSHAAAGLDSSLLFVFAVSGIVGLTAYIYLLQRMWSLSLPVKASLSALLIHSLFNNSLFYPWIMIWLWLLAAENVKEYS